MLNVSNLITRKSIKREARLKTVFNNATSSKTKFLGFFIELMVVIFVMAIWLLAYKHLGMQEYNQELLKDPNISLFSALILAAFPIFVGMVLPVMAISSLRKYQDKRGVPRWYE